MMKNYQISRISKDQILGLPETIFSFSQDAWTFNLTCMSLEGGSLLAIPVKDFITILKDNNDLKHEFVDFAKDQRKKMVDHVKALSMNNMHISLCNSSKL